MRRTPFSIWPVFIGVVPVVVAAGWGMYQVAVSRPVERMPAASPSGKPWAPIEVPERKDLIWKKMSREVAGKRKVLYWQAFEQGDERLQLEDPARRAETVRARIEEDEREKLLEHPERGLGCPAGMVHVAGRMLDWRVVQKRQDAACKDKGWSSGKRCEAYDRESSALKETRLRGKT